MLLKKSTTAKAKANLAVIKTNCPHCKAKKVSVLVSDGLCPKCGIKIPTKV
jgi:hypothetical protein